MPAKWKFSATHSACKPHLRRRSTGPPFTAGPRPPRGPHSTPWRRAGTSPRAPPCAFAQQRCGAVPAGSCSPLPRRRTAVSRRRGAMPSGSCSPLQRPPTGRCPRGTPLPVVLRGPSRSGAGTAAAMAWGWRLGLLGGLAVWTQRRRAAAAQGPVGGERRELELRLVQVVFRHGARTPLRPVPGAAPVRRRGAAAVGAGSLLCVFLPELGKT